MTYLSAVQEVAYLVGVQPPVSIGDASPVARRFRRFADRAGQEIARRADWNRMSATSLFTGDGGTVFFPLPVDYDRLMQGAPVWTENGFVRGSTSYDEWIALQSLPVASGAPTAPRFFLIARGNIHFHPVPPPAMVVNFTYMSRNWIVGATTENFTTDAQTTQFPERLLILDMVWRWRRAQGAPFDDELKEYEADLAAAANADAGLRPPTAQAA